MSSPTKPSKNQAPAVKPQSEAHFHQLISTLPQQVWTALPDGSLDYVNQHVIDYFGRSFDEMIGIGWVDLVHPDDLHETLLCWTRSLATGEDYDVGFRLRRFDGLYRWHIARASAVLDSQGHITQWIGASTDITQLKAAEAALAISEAHLSDAQSRALMGSWELDLVTNTGTASAEWFQTMGRDPSLNLPLANHFLAAIHPEDLERVRIFHSQALTQKNGSQYDFRIITPAGNIRWIEARMNTFFDEAGTPIRMVGTSQDISARKHIEMELQASEARLAAAQAHAKIGSWRRNLTTNEAEWSEEMYRLFNCDPAHKPPAFIDFVHLLHPDDRKPFVHYYNRYIREGGSYQIDFRVQQANGDCIWIEARSETLCDSNGKPLQLTGTAQDITTRKQAELALRTNTQILEDTQSLAKLGGWEFDITTQKLYWTDQIYRMLETTRDNLEPTVVNSLDYFAPESRTTLSEALDKAMNTGQSYDLELQMRSLKGRSLDVRATCSVVIENGKAVKLYGILQDISEQKAAKLALLAANRELERTNRALEHIAHYDALTHLPNRVLLADRMQQAMARTQRNEQIMAVAFLDLDGFKTVNDQHGHAMGDKLLVNIA